MGRDIKTLLSEISENEEGKDIDMCGTWDPVEIRRRLQAIADAPWRPASIPRPPRHEFSRVRPDEDPS